MKTAIKLFFVSLTLLFVLITSLIFLALEKESSITDVGIVNIESADQAKTTLKRIYSSFKSAMIENKGEQTYVGHLSLSKSEIDSVAALAHKVLPGIKLKNVFIDDAALVHVSYRLPALNRYINVSTDIYTSSNGLMMSDINIGSLSIPSKWLINLAIWLADKQLNEEVGQKLFDMITQVDVDNDRIIIDYAVPQSMSNKRGDTLAKLFKIRDDLSLYGNVGDIAHYHAKIVEVSELQATTKLSDYLSVVLTAAFAKAELDSSVSATEENYHALMALVLYLGHDKFELLVGNVSNGLTSKQIQIRNTLRNRLTLNDRVDLQKHFIYSVALQLFGSIDASDAMGEFKELLDANGGSGFSFADLLADRVGTRFAQLATSNERNAARLQQYFIGRVNESIFMPVHVDLPEGISQQDFERHYENTQSAKYKEMIAEIDSRLKATRVYQ